MSIKTKFDEFLVLDWYYASGCDLSPRILLWDERDFLPDVDDGYIDISELMSARCWPTLAPAFAVSLGITPDRLRKALDEVVLLIGEIEDVRADIDQRRTYEVLQQFDRGDWSGLPKDVYGHADGFVSSWALVKFWKDQRAVDKKFVARKMAKQSAMRARRQEFQKVRHELVLALLADGAPYQCSAAGCDSYEDLTVDHVVPLSRGGSDDLSNLRFLCRRCNSAKGDRAA